MHGRMAYAAGSSQDAWPSEHPDLYTAPPQQAPLMWWFHLWEIVLQKEALLPS